MMLNKTNVPRILVALWLTAIVLGFWGFAASDFAPGAGGTPASTWPAGLSLETDPARHTLLVALHPECPCSRATLDELERVLAESRNRLKAYAVFASYSDLPVPVERSRNWVRASAIPHLTVVRDADGSLGRRFDALTSGAVRLYGPEGDLRFHGGITISRGHAGPNPGATRVLDLVLERCGASAPVSTPVFGCPL